jgi:chaperonin GroEL
MTAKLYQFGEEAKQSILAGAELLYKSVGSTFGPRGSNVLIQKVTGEPKITKDGVSVARENDIKDYFLDMGLRSLKEVSVQTVDRVGDGTTGAVIFAYHLLKNGFASNLTPLQIDKLVDYSNYCVDLLNTLKIDISEKHDLLGAVAKTSANGDEEVEAIIKEGLKFLGADGNFLLEESKNKETHILASEGVYLPVGLTSPFYANTPGKVVCELENPVIILTDQKINFFDEIKYLIKHIQSDAEKQHRPIVIICNDISFEAEAGLVANIKSEGKYFKFACISMAKMLQEGHAQKVDLFEDLHKVFGGNLISKSQGLNLGATSAKLAAKSNNTGSCKKILITMSKTIIVPDEDRLDQIRAYSENIKDLAEKAQDEVEKKYHQRRLARLSDGVAVISVGGYSDQSAKEKKDRVEDAICAVQSARKHGVFPGGCSVYRYLLKKVTERFANEDCQSLAVFIEALNSMTEKLYKGLPEEMIPNFPESDDPLKWTGHNLKKVKTGKEPVVRVWDEGVIEAAFVSIETIRNGVDVVKLLLNTDTIIVYDIEEMRRSTPGYVSA